GVVEAPHFDGLEQDAGALAEHVLAVEIGKGLAVLGLDRPGTRAGQRDFARVFGGADRAGNAALAGAGEVTGDALDGVVVEPVERDLVVRAEEAERGADAADARAFGAAGEQRHVSDDDNDDQRDERDREAPEPAAHLAFGLSSQSGTGRFFDRRKSGLNSFD